MQPKSQRRVHGAEFKAQVLAECEEPGTSVAAVALAHGLNVNLLRKWLVGRGIKRTGLSAPRAATRVPLAASEPAAGSLEFIPVEFAQATAAGEQAATPNSPTPATDIHIELTRAGTHLSVRWPCAQAASCADWLRDLAASALKE
jgi:transposase